MANVESITLDEGQQADAARQFDFENVQKKQAQARQRAIKKNEQRLRRGVSQATAPADEALQTAAIQGYRRIWQISQEAVEDLAFSFVDFMIFSGPAVVILFFIRLVVGNWFGGGMTIKYNNFSMPLVPGYTVVEGFFRTAKFLFIGLLTGVLYSAILVSAYIFTHPLQTAQLALYAAFCWLSQFFGHLCGAS